ncbi:uncharacterized protein EI90DRAFT_2933135, partial [Cantharellus anzutake]|uniref:uncharacterized protein n=1 Tax=Cantharellus anzutake TaxID=1750568 RepID=UPI001904BE78
PSWRNASAMYEQVKEMPGPPSWTSEIVTLDEAPDEPQTLYWRNPVECAHFLFQNPDFDGSMAYAPSRVYDQHGTRVYTEMTTTEEWHLQQVSKHPSIE